MDSAPNVWGKTNIVTSSKFQRITFQGMLFSLTLAPGKIMEQVLWEHISEYKGDNKATEQTTWICQGLAVPDKCDCLLWWYQELMALVLMKWSPLPVRDSKSYKRSQGPDILFLSVCTMQQDEILFCICALFSLWFHCKVLTSTVYSVHLLTCFWHTWLNL